MRTTRERFTDAVTGIPFRAEIGRRDGAWTTTAIGIGVETKNDDVDRKPRSSERKVNRTRTVGSVARQGSDARRVGSPGSSPVTMNATQRPIITAWSAARS